MSLTLADSQREIPEKSTSSSLTNQRHLRCSVRATWQITRQMTLANGRQGMHRFRYRNWLAHWAAHYLATLYVISSIAPNFISRSLIPLSVSPPGDRSPVNPILIQRLAVCYVPALGYLAHSVISDRFIQCLVFRFVPVDSGACMVGTAEFPKQRRSKPAERSPHRTPIFDVQWRVGATFVRNLSRHRDSDPCMKHPLFRQEQIPIEAGDLDGKEEHGSPNKLLCLTAAEKRKFVSVLSLPECQVESDTLGNDKRRDS